MKQICRIFGERDSVSVSVLCVECLLKSMSS